MFVFDKVVSLRVMIFSLEGTKISISDKVLAIPEFASLQKKWGEGSVLFIGYVYDPDSPYINYSVSEKERKGIEICFGKDDVKAKKVIESKEFVSALNVFLDIIVLPEERAFMSYQNKIHQLVSAMDSTDITLENYDKVTSMMSKIPALIDLGKKLEEKMAKAKTDTGRKRGGRDINYIEMRQKRGLHKGNDSGL